MTLGGTFIASFTGANRSAANAVLLLSTMTGQSPESCYAYIRALRPIVFIEPVNFLHLNRVGKLFSQKYPSAQYLDLSTLVGEDYFRKNSPEVWIVKLGMLMLLVGTRLGLRLGIDPLPSCCCVLTLLS
jgi:hypothetical protein